MRKSRLLGKYIVVDVLLCIDAEATDNWSDRNMIEKVKKISIVLEGFIDKSGHNRMLYDLVSIYLGLLRKGIEEAA